MAVKDYVEWGDVSSTGANGPQGSIGRLFLKGENTYLVRPVLKPVVFAKYFRKDEQNRLRTAIVADPDNCSVRKNHSDLKFPSQRYAMYVIDRADNRLKVMEFPPSVFIAFNDRYALKKKKPGGAKEGGDWQIKVEGFGLKTSYRSQYVEDTPLTEEEVERVKGLVKNTKIKLIDLYKADSSEEIEKKLFGEWEDKKSKETVSTAASSEEADSDNDLGW